MAQAIRLIRVAIIVVIMFTLAACSSMKSPSMLPETTTVTPVVKSEVVIPIQTSQPIAEVPESKNDFTSEIDKTIKDEFLVEYVARKNRLPIDIAKRIVASATLNAYPDFPSRDDILAIAEVESSFVPKASHNGSYGIMQIERKSHLDKLKGRNVFDIEVNMEVGSTVLHQCYTLTNNSSKGATLAYNSGIGNFLKHRYKIEYYKKYLAALKEVKVQE